MKLYDLLRELGLGGAVLDYVEDIDMDKEVNIFVGNQLRPNQLYSIYSVQGNELGPALVVGDVVPRKDV